MTAHDLLSPIGISGLDGFHPGTGMGLGPGGRLQKNIRFLKGRHHRFRLGEQPGGDVLVDLDEGVDFFWGGNRLKF